MFETILVAVDGSHCARKALLDAASIAAASRALVLVVYVIDDPRSVFEMAFIDRQHMLRSVSAYGQDVLNGASILLESRGISHGVVLLSPSARRESVAERILDQAASAKVDLIVMGTHGRRGMRRLVMGSVSREVVHGAVVPVLLVPSEERA